MRPIKGASDSFFFACCREKTNDWSAAKFFGNSLKNALKSATNFNHMFDALDTLFIKRLIVLLKKKKGHFWVFYCFEIFG